MKNKKLFLSMIALATLAYSCEKQDDLGSSTGHPTGVGNYSKLKTGNYWIYQQFAMDSSGIASPTNVFDSCYVEKDTTINGQVYFKMVRPAVGPYSPVQYLRDSSNYLVDSDGRKVFSNHDFTSLFKTDLYVDTNGDTICDVITKMEDRNKLTATPAGLFTTMNARETYYMYPKYSMAGDVRHKHIRYAKNIGIVSEVLPFYVTHPDVTERRLVRYHVR